MPRPAELLVSVLENTFILPTGCLAHVQGQVLEALEGRRVAQCWGLQQVFVVQLFMGLLFWFSIPLASLLSSCFPIEVLGFTCTHRRGVLSLSDAFRAGFSHVSSSLSSDSSCE